MLEIYNYYLEHSLAAYLETYREPEISLLRMMRIIELRRAYLFYVMDDY